jgi:hypothetical protein
MLSVLIQFSVLCVIFTVAWSMGLYALLRDGGVGTMAASEFGGSEWTRAYRSFFGSVFTLCPVVQSLRRRLYMYKLHLLLIKL